MRMIPAIHTRRVSSWMKNSTLLRDQTFQGKDSHGEQVGPGQHLPVGAKEVAPARRKLALWGGVKEAIPWQPLSGASLVSVV